MLLAELNTFPKSSLLPSAAIAQAVAAEGSGDGIPHGSGFKQKRLDSKTQAGADCNSKLTPSLADRKVSQA